MGRQIPHPGPGPVDVAENISKSWGSNQELRGHHLILEHPWGAHLLPRAKVPQCPTGQAAQKAPARPTTRGIGLGVLMHRDPRDVRNWKPRVYEGVWKARDGRVVAHGKENERSNCKPHFRSPTSDQVEEKQI